MAPDNARAGSAVTRLRRYVDMKSTLEVTDREGRIDVVNDVGLTLHDLADVVRMAELFEELTDVQ